MLLSPATAMDMEVAAGPTNWSLLPGAVTVTPSWARVLPPASVALVTSVSRVAWLSLLLMVTLKRWATPLRVTWSLTASAPDAPAAVVAVLLRNVPVTSAPVPGTSDPDLKLPSRPFAVAVPAWTWNADLVEENTSCWLPSGLVLTEAAMPAERKLVLVLPAAAIAAFI